MVSLTPMGIEIITVYVYGPPFPHGKTGISIVSGTKELLGRLNKLIYMSFNNVLSSACST